MTTPPSKVVLSSSGIHPNGREWLTQVPHQPVLVLREYGVTARVDLPIPWSDFMTSADPITSQTQPEIPPCRRSAPGACAGPPETLPHAEQVEGLDRNAVAEHVNTCRTCRATLTRCMRGGCQPASGPFEILVRRTAHRVIAKFLHDARWPLGLVERQEALDEAAFKGLSLILTHESCSPERTIVDGHRNLTGLLMKSMDNAVRDWRRRKLVAGTWPEPGEAHGPLIDSLDELADGGIEVEDPVPDPADQVVLDDQIRCVHVIISDYRMGLDPAKRFVFDRWGAARIQGAPKVSQRAIAADLFATLEIKKDQATVSRWIEAFEKALVARIDADPGLEDFTREVARRLILGLAPPDGQSGPTDVPNPEDAAPDVPARTVDDSDDSDELEGHDD